MLPEIATTTVLDVAHTLSATAPQESVTSMTSMGSQLIGGMNTLEWVFVGFLLVVGLYGLTIGRERLVAMVFSVYATALIALSAIGLPIVNSLDPLLLLIGWLVIFILTSLLLSRTRAADIVTLFEGSIIKRLIFVLIIIGFIVSVVGKLIPLLLSSVSPLVALSFTSPIAQLVWVLMPLLGLAVIRGRIGRFDL